MVYFITDGIYIKIGKSKKPLKRIKNLQTSNPKTLKFLYLFDCKDIYEKKLHECLKPYKTISNNEWFDLREIDLYEIFNSFNNNIFKDVSLAKFKARQLNNELFRGLNHTKKAQQKVYNETYNIKSKKDKKLLRERRLSLIKDIENHLKNKKNKRISYNKYVIKYGFTKPEISMFIKGCRLSKRVYEHNKKVG